MSFFYPLKVNTALAGFGVPPDAVPRDLRQKMQDHGKHCGLTASETALCMIGAIFGVGYPDQNMDLIVGSLIKRRKIDPAKAEVLEALRQLHLA